MEALDPQLKYYQFGIKKALPKGEGRTVIWNKPTRLANGFVLSEGVPTSTGNALSTTTVSAIVRQFGGLTIVSDMVDMTSITDVMKLAAERLGVQAAETVEKVTILETMIAQTGTTLHLYKTSGMGSPIAGNICEYWGSVSGVTAVNATGGVGGPLASAHGASVASVSDFRTAVYRLKKMSVKPYEGNDFIAIIPVEVAENVVGDTTWINFHQYAAPGQANLYSGEIGKVYGIRFVETNYAPVGRGSTLGDTTSAYLFGSLIFGKGFYGVTELDGGIKTYITQGAEKSDPLNQTTTYGWKANFIAKVLNASCGLMLWTGNTQYTAAGRESADSYLRYDYPTAY